MKRSSLRGRMGDREIVRFARANLHLYNSDVHGVAGTRPSVEADLFIAECELSPHNMEEAAREDPGLPSGFARGEIAGRSVRRLGSAPSRSRARSKVTRPKLLPSARLSSVRGGLALLGRDDEALSPLIAEAIAITRESLTVAQFLGLDHADRVAQGARPRGGDRRAPSRGACPPRGWKRCARRRRPGEFTTRGGTSTRRSARRRWRPHVRFGAAESLIAEGRVDGRTRRAREGACLLPLGRSDVLPRAR